MRDIKLIVEDVVNEYLTKRLNRARKKMINTNYQPAYNDNGEVDYDDEIDDNDYDENEVDDYDEDETMFDEYGDKIYSFNPRAYKKIIKNEWIIHFTKGKQNVFNILNNGFKYGTKTLNYNLSYDVPTEDRLENGGLFFGFDLKDYSYGEGTFNIEGNSCGVVFKTNGIEDIFQTDSKKDNFHEVVFDGNKVYDLIGIERIDANSEYYPKIVAKLKYKYGSQKVHNPDFPVYNKMTKAEYKASNCCYRLFDKNNKTIIIIEEPNENTLSKTYEWLTNNIR